MLCPADACQVIKHATFWTVSNSKVIRKIFGISETEITKIIEILKFSQPIIRTKTWELSIFNFWEFWHKMIYR